MTAEEASERSKKAAATRKANAEKKAAEEAAAKEAAAAEETPPTEIPEGVHGKLWYIQTHAGYVEKTGTVKFGSANYQHMQEHGLLKVLKPLFRDTKTTFRVADVALQHEGNHTFLTTTYEFRDLESGESIEFVIPSEGVDSGDKGINKALTNGMKYALQKVFLIPTEDIDDVEGSDDAHNQTSSAGSASTSKAKKKSGPSERAKQLTADALARVEAGDVTQQKVVAYLQSELGKDRVDQLDDAGLTKFETWLKSL